MDRKVKIAHFGVGRMGSNMIEYELRKGGDLVCVFDADPKKVGVDIGELLRNKSIGLKVRDASELEQALQETKPDICMITTQSQLAQIKDTVAICLKNKVNVITIAEEAAWAWTSNKEDSDELDKLAKENGVTFCGSGYFDVIWGGLVSALTGVCVDIDTIRGECLIGLDDYGPQLMEAHGVGMTAEEFAENFKEEHMVEGGKLPCMPGDPNAWICSKLGLTVKTQYQKYEPIFAEKDTWSETLGITIPKGNVIGMFGVVVSETEQGIKIEFGNGGEIHAAGGEDKTIWSIHGDPELQIDVTKSDMTKVTASTPVNRIPTVINARPGYISTDELPDSAFILGQLHQYIK